jgi:glycosyltransferase involved in cell wall biosynthesis
MKLSVCIFTFNHEKYIASAIESVLRQKTDFDFEIVIGEDCSTDATPRIVREYEKNYPEKIRANFNSSNLGIMANNSQSILQCKGEYIALLDGDDYWTADDKLQKQVAFLESNPDYAFCFHDGKILRQDNTFESFTCCGPEHQTHVELKDIICNVHIPTFSLVFRKNALGNYPPPWFSSLDAPDRPLFLLLASHGPGYYLNQCWAVYRKHNQGHWTGRTYQSQWLTHLKIYKVLNRHFDLMYDKEFCRCESEVLFILARKLLQDGYTTRSASYFKRYLKINAMPAWHVKVYYNMFLYGLTFVRKKILSNTKTS